MRTPQSITARENPPSKIALEDLRLPVKAKLAAAWTSFMFLYVYVDILAFYKPGVVDDILVGVVWEFDITQTWAITALTLLAIPIFMILLSMTLPARASRITNLIVASLQVPFAAFNAVGELGQPWMYFYLLGVALEMIVLAFILRTAWTWPRRTASLSTLAPASTASPSARRSRRDCAPASGASRCGSDANSDPYLAFECFNQRADGALIGEAALGPQEPHCARCVSRA